MRKQMVRPGDDCPDKDRYHYPNQPEDYLERQEWAERMMKTHICEQCPSCKL